MDHQEILNTIFTVVVIPLLGVLVAYIVAFVKNKTNELKAKINNEQYDKYIDLAEQAILKAIICTNQTYVDGLKERNAFDKEAQIEAFQKTKEAVFNIIDGECKIFLQESIIDFDAWISNTIEELIHNLKII